MRYFFVIIVGLSFVTLSCNEQSFKSENELVSYVLDPNSGLTKEMTIGDNKIKIINRPTDLLVLQENMGSFLIEQNKLDSLRNHFGRHYYFIVSISKNGRPVEYNSYSQKEFADKLQRLSFEMGEYTNLTTSKKDTIPLSDYVYQRAYGMSTSSDILTVFSKNESQQSDWIQMNINEFGLGVGNMRFRFESNALRNTPKLIFSIQK